MAKKLMSMDGDECISMDNLRKFTTVEVINELTTWMRENQKGAFGIPQVGNEKVVDVIIPVIYINEFLDAR